MLLEILTLGELLDTWFSQAVFKPLVHILKAESVIELARRIPVQYR